MVGTGDLYGKRVVIVSAPPSAAPANPAPTHPQPTPAPQVQDDQARVIEQDGAHLLIDCTHLTFIDSTGIGVLLEANGTLEAAGRHMLIVNIPHGPRRVLETLGLTDLTRYDRD